jgi:hypothetical protein
MVYVPSGKFRSAYTPLLSVFETTPSCGIETSIPAAGVSFDRRGSNIVTVPETLRSARTVRVNGRGTPVVTLAGIVDKLERSYPVGNESGEAATV